MKISLLIPIYNVAEKIERCAVSLFEQTYKDMEFVFVNDCTPDNSIQVLESVLDRYPERKAQVKILHNERNLKQAGTRNRLLDNATGDLIMFVDSDDYLPLDACQKLFAKMQESGADIVSGAFVSLKPEGKTVTVSPTTHDGNKAYRRLLSFSYGSCMLWSRLYKASLFADTAMRAIEGVNLSEDYMMTSRVMLKAKMAFIPDVVYYYDETEVRDYSKIYEGHISQMERSVSAVLDYFNANKPLSLPYLPCIQIAFLHVVRTAARCGLRAPLAESKLTWWAKPLAALMYHKVTFPLANLLYKIARSAINR
ncbi:MAG: glycosyltransferase family 2 protein [Bacteroidaceae bacterium]|nr:glycosyltransferase family 2 protein [Bacteroidaceae bacterium]